MTYSIQWESPIGKVCTVHVCDYESEWNNLGGVYNLCRSNNLQNSWVPLYIGRTNNFKIRLSDHEQWSLAVRLGATKVLVLVEQSEFKRKILEDMLIQFFDPPLNKQLRLTYPPRLGVRY